MSQRKTPRAGTPAFRQYVMEQLQRRMLVDAPLQLASDGLDLNDPTAGGLDPALYADPAPSEGADGSLDDGFTPLDSASFGSYSTPTLNVRSTANGSETGPVNGNFRFSLTYGVYGSPYTAPSNITVNYGRGGTATAGMDYGVYNLPGSVVIPAGSSFVDVPYTPVNDTVVENPDETVIVTAQASPAFTLGLNPATSTILRTQIKNMTAVDGQNRNVATMVGGATVVFVSGDDGMGNPESFATDKVNILSVTNPAGTVVWTGSFTITSQSANGSGVLQVDIGLAPAPAPVPPAGDYTMTLELAAKPTPPVTCQITIRI